MYILHPTADKAWAALACRVCRGGLGSLAHCVLGVQGSEAGGADAWIGNIQINPSKGKAATAPPLDPKGRQGLAEVLTPSKPGAPPAAPVAPAGH